MEEFAKFENLINGAYRYQLQDYCIFVDARDLEDNRYPEKIPHPHVLNKSSKGEYTYLPLNDAAGFIAAFIVEGVDVRLIPEILRSEYESTLEDKVKEVDFVAQVDAVLGMLRPYLVERTYERTYATPQPLRPGTITEGYSLDFSVNWYPIGGRKRPIA